MDSKRSSLSGCPGTAKWSGRIAAVVTQGRSLGAVTQGRSLGGIDLGTIARPSARIGCVHWAAEPQHDYDQGYGTKGQADPPGHIEADGQSPKHN